jgi:hypothetical protein
LSANALLASLLVGSVGLGFFAYGKKQRRGPHLAAGVLMMVYPYFVSNVPLMLGIGAALVGLVCLASYVGL